MRIAMIFAALIWLCAAASADLSAQTMECGQYYTVQRGDTLQKIAKRAYDRASAYQIIVSANREEIGRNIRIIHIGTKLWIPCLAPPPEQAVREVEDRRSGPPQIKLLTGSDFAPFTDRDLENGGMLTELVNRALQTADPELTYRVDFIDDWASHLRPLLSEGAYDLGSPWYKPDCAQADRLGAESRWRCENLIFSEPFFETVVGYYSMVGKGPRFYTPSDLRGKRLCRPRGFFTFDLEARQLVEPNVTLVRPRTVGECFDLLLGGKVDLVTINVHTIDTVSKQRNLDDKIVEHTDLATIATLHVVALKTHPRARSLMLRINRGLKALRESGIYRRVTTRHLANALK